MGASDWSFHMLGLVLVLCVAVLAGYELGFRAGDRLARNAGRDADKGLGAVDGMVFGLLGLLIAFTFSGAGDRFDARRDLVAQEANAISTSYLRLDVLGAELSAPIRPLYLEYVSVRIGETQRPRVDPRRPGSQRATEELQARIWAATLAALEQRGQPALVGPVLGPLNEMIDITTSRRMAAMTHPPAVVFGALFLISPLAAFLAGHARGTIGIRGPTHLAVFTLAIAGSIYLILELEFPRLGFLTVEAADVVLLDLLDSMGEAAPRPR